MEGPAEEKVAKDESFVGIMKSTLKLTITPKMMLVNPLLLYSGISLTYQVGVLISIFYL